MSKRKLNCFIASAFGKSDVDEIFDNAICPILKEFHIRPFRVDREEHNEDIDDHIFTLLNQSQICIADLTHARPSVYYEAGYASGCSKPVIYIARKDHFHPNEKDEAGNRKIHFDLQMKNIIPWTESNNDFKKNLRSRLKYVLKDLKGLQKDRERELRYEKEFAELSQSEQLDSIDSKARNLLRRHGYSNIHVKKNNEKNKYIFTKKENKIFREIYINPKPTINKELCDSFIFYLNLLSLVNKKLDDIVSIQVAIILISLRQIKNNTLRSYFPSWKPGGNKIFTSNMKLVDDEDVLKSQTVSIIDNIKSIQSFSKRFLDFIKKWENP